MIATKPKESPERVARGLLHERKALQAYLYLLVHDPKFSNHLEAAGFAAYLDGRIRLEDLAVRWDKRVARQVPSRQEELREKFRLLTEGLAQVYPRIHRSPVSGLYDDLYGTVLSFLKGNGK